ncbi:MAG TPA: carotenoid oxygenase family protein [Polyangiales bacterium]|nr:carotenoid oxygenase family protein [Polyangiales bacterium]
MSDFDRQLFQRSLPRAHDFEPLESTGVIPPELDGTLYRVGPGKFSAFGKPYAHPFDGDAAVTAVRLRRGRAWAAARLVETEGLREEQRRGQILYGAAAPWLRRMRNAHGGKEKATPNVNLLHWQGRLFALNEGGPPVEVDPDNLNALGEDTLAAAVSGAFCAHPHRVASRRTTYNVGMEYGVKTQLAIYELPDAGPARRLGSIPFDEPPIVHDFAATETHLVFFVSPVRLRMWRHFLQLGHFGDLFAWRPERGTEVIVVPLADPERCQRFQVPSFFQWHFANAYHERDALIVDYVRFADMSPITELTSEAPSAPFRSARYHRATLYPDQRRFESAELGPAGCEFPRVHPQIEGQRHTVSWLASGDLGAILALDPQTGSHQRHDFARGEWCGEPVFVPRNGATPGDERDGYVVALCHDDASDRGFLSIHDGRSLEALGRIWFNQYVPVTFHGQWVTRAPDVAAL